MKKEIFGYVLIGCGMILAYFHTKLLILPTHKKLSEFAPYAESIRDHLYGCGGMLVIVLPALLSLGLIYFGLKISKGEI